MKKVKLRIANDKELGNLAKIYAQEFSKPPYSEPWNYEKAIERMKFYKKSYDLYTILFNEKIVGFICVNPKFMCPGEVAFGEEIAIDEKFQHKGIGTDVFNQIFGIYAKKGFKRFLGISNASLREFYSKLGINQSREDVIIEKNLQNNESSKN